MTDDSRFVLRWEIDNATARFATGKVESGVFDKGGFRWTISVEKNPNCDDGAIFALKCDAGHNGPWKCDTIVDVRQNGCRYVLIRENNFCFDANNSISIHTGRRWSYRTNLDCIINDKAVFEFHINIVSSENGELIAAPSMFIAPNRRSDVILKIGDEKLHVSKEYLSVQSPFFETLFFGEFAEKGKEEVEIKDVVYEEFVDLLHLIYHKTMTITDRKIVHILKLADQFQMEDILKHAKTCLTESKGIDVMTKLAVADRYGLGDLKEHCFQSFTTSTELYQKIMASRECVDFSAEMKAAIFDRMKDLKPQ